MENYSRQIEEGRHYDIDGEGWPRDLESGDEREITRSWHYFLTENIADAGVAARLETLPNPGSWSGARSALKINQMLTEQFCQTLITFLRGYYATKLQARFLTFC